MQSVIVHYQEIALKGKNRPWFVARLVRNLRAATSDLDVRVGARADGADRDRARARRGLGAWCAIGWRACSASATSRRPAARRSTSRRSRRHILDGSRRPADRDVPRVGAARRQALSADLAGDRARSRRPDQGGARLDGEPRAPGADDPRRGADRRGVLFLRQGSRAPAGFRSAPAAASSACCRAASIRRSRRGG